VLVLFQPARGDARLPAPNVSDVARSAPLSFIQPRKYRLARRARAPEQQKNMEVQVNQESRTSAMDSPSNTVHTWRTAACERCAPFARKTNRSLPPDNPADAADWNKEKRRDTRMGASDLKGWFGELAAIENPVRREFHLFTLLSRSTARLESRPRSRATRQPRCQHCAKSPDASGKLQGSLRKTGGSKVNMAIGLNGRRGQDRPI
jgi:hypothetical protein